MKILQRLIYVVILIATRAAADDATHQSLTIPTDLTAGRGYAAFIVPPLGANLTLTLRPVNGYKLGIPIVVPEDTGDVNLWNPPSGVSGPGTFTFTSGLVLSSQEYLRIHGTFDQIGSGGTSGSGGHGGANNTTTINPNQFVVDVPGVDIDIDGVAEEKEETEGGGVNMASSTLTKLIVNRVQRENHFSGDVTISIEEPAGDGRVSLWHNPQGTIAAPMTYATPSELPETIYVKGEHLSSAVRDVGITASYTIAGKITEDKVKLTILKVNLQKTPAVFLPKGGSDANETTIRAFVEPNTIQGKFRFTLFDVSNIRGYCMNAPNPIPLTGENSATWKDLQFLDLQPDFVISGGNRDSAETVAANLNEKTVKVKSFDYGSFGKIKVAFILTGTTTACPGIEEAGASEFTRIPLDANANDIADAAPQNSGPAGTFSRNDDNDPHPTGNGSTPGDLLTRYEEYRGFMVGGVHTRTDTTKMDVFLRDLTGHTTTDGNGSPLALFSKLGCDVHLIAAGESRDSDRLINFNGGVTAQRALWVQASTGAAASAVPGGTGGAWGRTGNLPLSLSTYKFCRVWVDALKRSVKLFKAINSQPQDAIIYDSDADFVFDWTPNGKVKIEDEIISYGVGLSPNTALSSTTAIIAVPADSTAIIVDVLRPGLKYVHIDDEVVDVGFASTVANPHFPDVLPTPEAASYSLAP